jgi:cytochrome b561
MSLSTLSGWFALACIVVAACVPLGARLRAGKRATPGSPPIKLHVMLGFGTSIAAFLHTLLVLPALGSPAAIAGGMLALAPAGAAFFLLMAHTGIGLQLRDEKLRDRAKKRRMHATTAISIACAVGLHVFALLRAAAD